MKPFGVAVVTTTGFFFILAGSIAHGHDALNFIAIGGGMIGLMIVALLAEIVSKLDKISLDRS